MGIGDSLRREKEKDSRGEGTELRRRPLSTSRLLEIGDGVEGEHKPRNPLKCDKQQDKRKKRRARRIDGQSERQEGEGLSTRFHEEDGGER